MIKLELTIYITAGRENERRICTKLCVFSPTTTSPVAAARPNRRCTEASGGIFKAGVTGTDKDDSFHRKRDTAVRKPSVCFLPTPALAQPTRQMR